MEDPSNWFKCAVCNEPTRFFHLNARLCRPCASFYRRATVEGLQYECKANGNCNIDQSRTSCRACRMRKIKEAGAQLEGSSPPAILPAKSKKPTASVQKGERLQRILSGYTELLQAQRSIVVHMFPQLGIEAGRSIPAQKLMMSNVEKRSLPCLIRFFNENFGPFRSISRKQKLRIILDVFHDFIVLNRAYLTAKYFPSEDDRRVMFHEGLFVVFVPTEEMVRWFFHDFIAPNQIENYMSVVLPLIRKYCRSNVQFKRLKCRQTDIAGMIFLALWKRIEYAGLMTDELAAYKEAVVAEWAADLRRELGAKEAIQQFAKLMSFYVDSDGLTNELKAAETVLRVKSLREEEDEMCNIEAHLKSLDFGVDEETQESRI
ncbi:COUP transcription factor 2 [Aphelenchoides fujianensis]|nr:COUP transcription factor 2 [Aphelenchoides fujianensis]